MSGTGDGWRTLRWGPHRCGSCCSRSTTLAAVREHVDRFAGMIRTLGGADLPQWITNVQADDLPSLHTFTKGLQRDLDAVTAGHTLPYSSGAIEGAVNRIKTVKRSMYGRA